VCNAVEFTLEIVECFRDGLDDFLSYPCGDADVLIRLKRLLAGEGEDPAQVAPRFGGLIGSSQSFLEVLSKVPRIAQSRATVLITGETGTGKELLARAIHYESSRRGEPFVPVNCGAIPDHLLENELFGHARGAFTDASTAEKGLLAEAEGGTLFLDEIDTLSASAQVKLLRLLQEGEYRVLGAAKIQRADVRIVAATNANLRQLIEKQAFREDLFHRLNVLTLHVPTLKERVDDVVPLAKYFLEKYQSESTGGTLRLSPEAMQKLIHYAWPGNVRELERTLQRAAILATGPVLEAADIELSSQAPSHESFQRAKDEAIRNFERIYLAGLLAAHHGNVTRAAKAAGKERRSLQRLLTKHRLFHAAYQ
jgi:DNA-binding NtrC family response regulator